MKLNSHAVGEVLKLIRRPVTIDPDTSYREIGIRSFGRGIFRKEPRSGMEIGQKRVFWIEEGDLVLSNVFAWEGAVAVASEADNGFIGSHRFMTYRVKEDIAVTRFLFYYFISDAGLAVIRRASPGSAGRNKTLGIEAFANQVIEAYAERSLKK